MAGTLQSSYTDDADGPLSDINVTPLVDVVLVLLIVFMITVPALVSSARVNVDLPETTAVAADTDQLPLVFALKQNQTGEPELFLNDKPVDEESVRKLFASSKPSDEQRVSLSADKGIPYGQVIEVVDLLESLGLKKLSLDTRHVEPR
jgi:biopolymer transport protein ExbD